MAISAWQYVARLRPAQAWRTSGYMVAAVLVAALSTPSWSAGPAPSTLERLPPLGLDPAAVTVSGLSSGGYMAAQFQVAYAASLAGAAIVAGGPYGCSRGLVSTASLKCSCPSEKGFLGELANQIPGLGCEVYAPEVYATIAERATAGNEGHIDSPAALSNHRVWLFSGGQDHVVDRRIVTGLATYLRRAGVAEERLRHVDLDDAGHGFPTPFAPLACGATKTPFLTQCQVDGAGELLRWLYPGPAPLRVAEPVAGSLKRFRQTRYRSQEAFNGLDTTGWVYVPQACEQAGARCRLHVAFHGCQQGQGFVAGGKPYGLQFVQGAGYNRWAEGSGVVVLYPQVKPSNLGGVYDPYRFNPKGCWDFWGYTERYAASQPTAPGFARREAPQMRAVKAMIDDLLRAP